MRKAVVRRRRVAGFTLIELVILLAIVGIAVLIGMPALLNSIHRARFEGAVREVQSMMHAARLEAIRFSADCYVLADFAGDRVVTFRETNGVDGLQTAADEELRSFTMPVRVEFWSPEDGAAEGATAATFTGATAQYVSTGRAEENGAFRFGDGRGNFIELNLEPAATGRLQLRKWDGAAWKAQGEGGVSWDWL